jgi:hypothetical protein
MVNTLDRLKILISSSTPIVVMETVEEMRAVGLVRTVCHGSRRPVEAQFHVVRGLALRSWRSSLRAFAVKKNLTAKNAKDSQGCKSLGQGAN